MSGYVNIYRFSEFLSANGSLATALQGFKESLLNRYWFHANLSHSDAKRLLENGMTSSVRIPSLYLLEISVSRNHNIYPILLFTHYPH